MTFQRGDWVHFSTKAWPPGRRAMMISLDRPGESEDGTGKGAYLGRGKIVRATKDGYLIREERGGGLVQVGADEEVRLMEKAKYRTLTLGDLRKFLAEHADTPDDIPVVVNLPICFNCDDDDLALP